MLILAVLCALLFASAAFAQGNIATYPLLPAGSSSIRVFDRQGQFVGRILPAKRYWVGINQIPDFLQKALIAVEDARFYEHGGIDMRGIARALVKDVMKRRMAEGGSTITQQLIKNKYSMNEKTIQRKVKEGMLAMEYEKKYTKKQILEMYFNEIYFGNGTWGIAQAARFYFDKNPQELNEIECVLLAATPKAPNRYNPAGNPTDVVKRKNLILNRMAELKMITARQEKRLRSRRYAVIKAGQAPYYLAHVRYKLMEQYGAGITEQGGLDVITGMDLPMQRLAEKALEEGVRRISPQLQGALLAI
ncbi:MAG: penicillin-binding protein, partial [Syntrophaceae bacterium]|nr:penicillin-binding protein [Syntrophaceae bacterium]